MATVNSVTNAANNTNEHIEKIYNEKRTAVHFTNMYIIYYL